MGVGRKVLFAVLGSVLMAAANTGVAAATHLGGPFGDGVHQVGSEETVFDYSVDACAQNHIPDAAVRAFKDPDGQVQLLVPHGAGSGGESMSQTRRMLGTSLDNVDVDCNVVHESSDSHDPSTFNNNEWLVSPYMTNDGTVYALVHNEYQGYRELSPNVRLDPNCEFDLPFCWYNSITFAYSTQDGPNSFGDSYAHANPPHHRIATIPYQYESNELAYGYFQPTNIVKANDGYYYALFRVHANSSNAPAQAPAQPGAITCVMRTNTLHLAGSWRAWDGDGFDVAFANPYPQPPADPGNHVCKTLPGLQSPSGLQSLVGMANNLVYSTYLDRWVLVDFSSLGGDDRGVFYSTSENLVDWEPRKLLLRTNILGLDDRCDDPPANGYPQMVAHPALLDPDSSDVNFATVGQTAYLYFTKFNGGCPEGNHLDRDLVRIPIRFGTARLADYQAPGCVYGFDRHVNTGPSNFTQDSTHRYTTGGAYKASMVTGATFGVFDREGTPPSPPNCEDPNNSPRPSIGYSEGDEVWYSGAFYFPSTGFWDQVTGTSTVSVLKLQPPGAASWGGMFMIRGDGNVRFSTSDGVNPRHNILFAPDGTLGVNLVNKENCWHFFEVHQKFSSDESKAVNEVWIDGVKKTNEEQSTTQNYFGTPWREIRAGLFNKGAGVGQPQLWTDFLTFNSTGPTPYIDCQS